MAELEEQGAGVRWPPATDDVSPGAEERPLLEDITQKHSENRDWEHYSVCDSGLCSVVTRARSLEIEVKECIS
jgi:hypothetical protein